MHQVQGALATHKLSCCILSLAWNFGITQFLLILYVGLWQGVLLHWAHQVSQARATHKLSYCTCDFGKEFYSIERTKFHKHMQHTNFHFGRKKKRKQQQQQQSYFHTVHAIVTGISTPLSAPSFTSMYNTKTFTLYMRLWQGVLLHWTHQVSQAHTTHKLSYGKKSNFHTVHAIVAGSSTPLSTPSFTNTCNTQTYTLYVQLWQGVLLR